MIAPRKSFDILALYKSDYYYYYYYEVKQSRLVKALTLWGTHGTLTHQSTPRSSSLAACIKVFPVLTST